MILDNTEGKVVRLEEQLGELVAYSRGIEARFAKMQLLQQAAAIARLDRFEDAFNLSCRKRIVVQDQTCHLLLLRNYFVHRTNTDLIEPELRHLIQLEMLEPYAAFFYSFEYLASLFHATGQVL